MFLLILSNLGQNVPKIRSCDVMYSFIYKSFSALILLFARNVLIHFLGTQEKKMNKKNLIKVSYEKKYQLEN